ncbi:MAG: MotA/TolQ/ExbB proton channel family protein [Bacteroidales bacterium]|jgi:biopolymer transport protein ExbB|nr:MotA/TolQ/ExbB proton channel family protein [Bacteroidales bacterium]
MLLNVLLQVTVQDQAVASALDMPKEISMPLWDLTLKGGWIMIPIAVLSIIAVYIFVERYFAIRKASKTDENFMNRIKDYIHDGKIDSALALCQSTDSPIARMIEKGIQRIGRPLSDINTAIENVGRLEIFKLERGLPALATAAGGAPMLGFLGTVTGMVKAFYDMSMAGNNIDIGILSSGIYEAMVTTVAGLLVGIVAYFAYNILVANVEKVVNDLEANTTEFMDLLNEPVK